MKLIRVSQGAYPCQDMHIDQTFVQWNIEKEASWSKPTHFT